jgi:hypothetical protein
LRRGPGALARAGLTPRLKKLRWALLKNRKNWKSYRSHSVSDHGL